MALVYLIHRWPMLEKIRKTLSAAILVAMFSGQRLRMRKAGSCKAQIGHFGKYHNILCLSPQILHKHCFQFLLGHTMVPRENKNNAYANFGGTNKEYYGIFRSGLFWKRAWIFLRCEVNYCKNKCSEPTILF